MKTEEKIWKYYQYLINQKENCKKWIQDSLSKDISIKTLNMKLEMINNMISLYEHYFKEDIVGIVTGDIQDDIEENNYELDDIGI